MLGCANVKYNVDIAGLGSTTATSATATARIAWQILAGIRKSISPNIDLGLKYRFFNVSKLDFGDDDDGGEH